MTSFDTTSFDLATGTLDDADLDAVTGGSLEGILSPQLALAYHPVGGWTMPDVFAKPVLGRYTPR